MNAVILCGGKGTRLKSISKGLPKILIPIENKPFIYFLLESLIKNGFKKIFLLISYKSKYIKNEVGDYYKNIPIVYLEDKKELIAGTASAIYSSYEELPEHFVMQYGDTILNLDYKDFYKKSQSLEDAILMAIYKNEEGLDNNNVLYKDKKLNYFNTESNMNLKNIKSSNYIDYGLLGIKKSFLEKNIYLLKENASLKHFQEKTSNLNLIKPYFAKERFYEIGTPKSYEMFKKALKNGELNNHLNICLDF